MCSCWSLLTLHSLCCPAPPTAMQQHWRAQCPLQEDPLSWTSGLCSNRNSSTPWQKKSKTTLLQLSVLLSFILTLEKKVVRSWSQLCSINTLQLPYTHTATKRFQPSYFSYELHITQLWSRYEYCFLSEIFSAQDKHSSFTIKHFYTNPLLTFHSTFQK